MDHDTVPELEKIINNANTISEKKADYQLNNGPSPFKKQAFITFGTFLLTLNAGATAGYSAILIPQLLKDKEKGYYSLELISWLASMSSFALLFGNILSGYTMERLGRKNSLIIIASVFIVGWATIAFSNDNTSLILCGRFITGLCQGWLGPLGPVFIGEISSPIYRGLFLAALSLSIAGGIFLSHLFGTFLRWNIVALLCGVFPMIAGVIIYFAPESPSWLASKNRIDECIQSFQWYRGHSEAMKEELDKMIYEQTKKDHAQSKMQALSRNIKKPEFWKPLTVMMTFFLITQLSGVNVICAYTTDIMSELMGNQGDNSNAYAAMLSVDILRCASLVVACILLRKSGRRPLAIYSAIFTSASLISLAVYLYLVKVNIIERISPFVSLGLMGIYIIVSHLGLTPLPWNMVGELFASETKGVGSGISVMMTSIAFFGTVKSAPYLFKLIGHHGAYLFYGLSTLLGSVFLFFCLPETKGKTLLQIEEHYRRKSIDIEERNKLKSNNLV